MIFKEVGVVGAGTMGHGIALALAKAGIKVVLVDLNESVLKNSMNKMYSDIELFDSEGLLAFSPNEIIGNIKFSSDLESLKDSEFVVEAIIEKVGPKQELFKNLEKICGSETIFGSNTSSLKLSEISKFIKRKDKVILTHWFNPAHIIPLVELLRLPETSDDTYNKIKKFHEDCGKETIIVNHELPGLVANRIQIAMAREVFALIEDNVASIKDIDKAITAGPGFRLPISGFIEIADLGGLDVWNAIATYLLEYIDSSTGPIKLLEDKVAKGELGAKSGKGFFDYKGKGMDELIISRDKKLIKQLKFLYEK